LALKKIVTKLEVCSTHYGNLLVRVLGVSSNNRRRSRRR